MEKNYTGWYCPVCVENLKCYALTDTNTLTLFVAQIKRTFTPVK